MPIDVGGATSSRSPRADHAASPQGVGLDGRETTEEKYNLLAHLRTGNSGAPRHRSHSPRPSKVKATSAVWDPNGNWIRDMNPRQKLFVKKPDTLKAENQKKLGSLRGYVEKNHLRNTMTHFKSRSFGWHDEFKNANDVRQTLDLIVRHGGAAQRRTRKAHRAEGFKFLFADTKKDAAPNQKGADKPGQKQQIRTTHHRALAHAVEIRKDIDSKTQDIVDDGSDEAQREEELKRQAMGRHAPRIKPVSTRVTAPFGGYNLSLTCTRDNPQQRKTIERELSPFKNVPWRAVNASNLEEHIVTRYCLGFDPYESSRMWPAVRLLAHARNDKVLRKTESLPTDLFEIENETDSDMETVSQIRSRRQRTRMGKDLAGGLKYTA
ncbi:unnamed protein product [Amoebophrya sp. A25]|nr:unnamed protein product [Amoebophrya sp. A25]|eukprot:GSA25T00010548001.1